MSYILDALKKADRERSLAKVPTLTTVHVPLFSGGRRIVVWVVSGVVVVGGGAFLWTVRPSPPATLPPVAESRAGSGAALPVGVAEPTPAAPLQPMAPAPPRPPSVPDVPTTPVKPVGVGEPRAPSTPAEPSPFRSPPPRRVLQPAAPRQATPDPPVPATPPSPAGLDPVSSPSAGRPGAEIAVAPAPGSSTGPSVLREALGKMTLDVFVYTELEADRMVVINGKRYTKGEFVNGLYLIENITSAGVVLSYLGEQAVLRP
jgi:general secretion pathway protein B